MPSSPALPSSPAADGLQVRPFRALTYRQRDPGHLARVSSPAYDLVTPAGRERLAESDAHNIVRLILPRVEPDAAEPPGRLQERSAERAAANLLEWQNEGVLERDDVPALWLYELAPEGSKHPTVGWLGAVVLPAPGSRAVLPHEDTYPPAVEGRRALLAATRTDLEPIVLAHDPDETVAELTSLVRQAPPTLSVQDADGVSHRLWRVSDPALLAELVPALRRTSAVIADGHHRFAAAQAHHRQVAGSDALLALLTPMGTGGLHVEAIHRVVPELSLDEALPAAAAGFDVRQLPTPADSGALVAAATDWLHDPAATGFLLTDAQRLVHLHDPTPEVLGTVPAEAPPAWRGLDVVLAHHGLVEHLWRRTDDPDSVQVAHDVAEAVQTAAERRGVAVLLRAPSPADVAAVARAGARMPRKSTLFVPKPRTGLIMRPHDD